VNDGGDGRPAHKDEIVQQRWTLLFVGLQSVGTDFDIHRFGGFGRARISPIFRLQLEVWVGSSKPEFTRHTRRIRGGRELWALT
jgi:hypothetical protein